MQPIAISRNHDLFDPKKIWNFLCLSRCSLRSSWLQSGIGQFNTLTSNWWEMIICTNGDSVCRNIYASSGINVSKDIVSVGEVESCLDAVSHPNLWYTMTSSMETFSVLLAICAGNWPVPGEFPAQRPVTRSFDVFFDLHPNKRLSKQWWGWWFETASSPLWRYCNDLKTCICNIGWYSNRSKYILYMISKPIKPQR